MREILVYDDYEIHKLGAGGGTEYEEVTTEKATSIYVTDVAKPKGKLIPFGRTLQNGEPTPENPINIENVEGNINVVVCNKNLFDKSNITSSRRLATDGTLTSNNASNSFVSEFIKVSSNVSYYKNSPTEDAYHRVCFYAGNTNDTFISATTNNAITTPSNCEYLRFCGYLDELDTTQLEKGSTATPYEEHKEQTILFPLAEGQKLMEGDYFADDGIHHVKGQILLDGTEESWRADNNKTLFGVSLPNAKENKSTSAIPYGYCNRAIIGSLNNARTHEYNFSIYGSSNSVMCWFNDRDITLNEFKTWLSTNNINVEYELDEETIEPYTEAQAESYNKLMNLMLYKGVNNIWTETDGSEPNLQLTYKRVKQEGVLQVSNIQPLNNLELNNTEETPEEITTEISEE